MSRPKDFTVFARFLFSMAEGGCGELYYDKFLGVGPAANCTPAAWGADVALAPQGVAGAGVCWITVGGLDPVDVGDAAAPDMLAYI